MVPLGELIKQDQETGRLATKDTGRPKKCDISVTLLKDIGLSKKDSQVGWITSITIISNTCALAKTLILKFLIISASWRSRGMSWRKI